ncbi:formylmethanofuran dehydrogenase subunit C [Mangrovicella endophytica]|uniref:formylmethanofuran dehydrogenase subunit C n=1 Tax=Mangrovicella endophytica TaxID=2066697 RepID=UPI000C9DF5AB|nr:formylmethanofuran dehydrogenase subunit C [Mangrovicella endophytica]
MSGLTFTLKAEPNQRLDLSSLVPGRLDGLSEMAIAVLPIGTTKELLVVGDLFDIALGDTASIRLEGGSERFDRVGEGLSAGAVHVEGDVGFRAGRAMTGGTLTIAGSAGPHAGSGMSGGTITIAGDAGERLGGPLAGEMAGMSGGLIRVLGSAGPRAGDKLRRGTILVAGDAGEHAGSRMIAGTLVVGGRAGPGAGRLMKRGTLVLAGGADGLSPTFLDNGPADLLILGLMAKAFSGSAIGMPLITGAPMRRYGGDTAVLGKGEVFVPLA